MTLPRLMRPLPDDLGQAALILVLVIAHGLFGLRAASLANFPRTLALPDDVEHWSLTTLRIRLIKIGARIVRHGHWMAFQMAEVMIPRAVFGADPRGNHCPAPIAAAGSMLSVAGRIGRAGLRKERRVRISTDRARFPLRWRPLTG